MAQILGYIGGCGTLIRGSVIPAEDRNVAIPYEDRIIAISAHDDGGK